MKRKMLKMHFKITKRILKDTFLTFYIAKNSLLEAIEISAFTA